MKPKIRWTESPPVCGQESAARGTWLGSRIPRPRAVTRAGAAPRPPCHPLSPLLCLRAPLSPTAKGQDLTTPGGPAVTSFS
jgi:hypothetical protein